MASSVTFFKLTKDQQAEYLFRRFLDPMCTEDSPFYPTIKESIRYDLSSAAWDKNVDFEYVSEEAFKTLSSKYAKNIRPNCYHARGRHSDLRFEHVIPTEYLYQEFLKRRRDKTLSEAFVLMALNKAKVSIISLDEDKVLTQIGLQRTMPSGFDIEKDDPFIRYQAAGIKMHKWAGQDK